MNAGRAVNTHCWYSPGEASFPAYQGHGVKHGLAGRQLGGGGWEDGTDRGTCRLKGLVTEAAGLVYRDRNVRSVMAKR